MSKIRLSTCLWFGPEIEEAVNFYTSLFDDGRITAISYYGEGMPLPKGSVMTMHFVIGGQEYMALQGPSGIAFNEAMSMVATCETQAEIDRLWDGLTADGGAEVQCGWLKDRYGISWQIVPALMAKMLQSGDAAGLERTMVALGGMVKLDIAALEAAYHGRA